MDVLVGTAILAIVPFVLAAYGGYLAAETIQDLRVRQSTKLKFWGLCIIGIILAFYQQYRSSELDTKKVNDLNQALARLASRAFLYVKVLPTQKPDDTGVITLPFQVYNISDVGSGGPVSAFVHLCDKCTFVGYSPGFQDNDSNGRERIANLIALDPGVHTDIVKIRIKVPDEKYQIAIFCSCQNCLREAITNQKQWWWVYFPPYLG